MSFSALTSIRNEVHEYSRSCENLLAAALAPNRPTLSQNELQLVEFYMVEIGKMHASLTKQS